MKIKKQMEEDLAYFRMKLWLTKRRAPLVDCRDLEKQIQLLESCIEKYKQEKAK